MFYKDFQLLKKFFIKHMQNYDNINCNDIDDDVMFEIIF